MDLASGAASAAAAADAFDKLFSDKDGGGAECGLASQSASASLSEAASAEASSAMVDSSTTPGVARTDDESARAATTIVLCDLPLDVITGRGKHSAGGTAVLKVGHRSFVRGDSG